MKKSFEENFFTSDGRLRQSVRTVPWNQLGSVSSCLRWIETEFVGKDGSRWVKAVADQKQITAPRHIIEILYMALPTFIYFPKIPNFSIAQELVSYKYFERLDDVWFLDAAYKIFLERRADPAGLKHYKMMLDKGVARSKIMADFSKSYEFTHQANRLLLRDSQLAAAKEQIRVRCENLMYRIPRNLPRDFFFRRPQAISENQSQSEWHFVYLPGVAEKMILSPGMNLCGKYKTKNVFVCELDWILFGPKISIRSGRYEVFLDFESNEEFRYVVDGVADSGLHRIFFLELRGPSQMRFAVDLESNVRDFEIRILNTSPRQEIVSIKHLSLKRIG